MTDELRKVAEAARKYPQPEITADDRREGASIVRNSTAPDKGVMAERMLSGEMDDCPLIRSLARVRVHGIRAGAGEYVPATFDPPTVLALLDRLTALEAERAGDQGRIQYLESVIASYVRATGFDDSGPCPICNGIEGCSHSFGERLRAKWFARQMAVNSASGIDECMDENPALRTALEAERAKGEARVGELERVLACYSDDQHCDMCERLVSPGNAARAALADQPTSLQKTQTSADQPATI